MKANRLKWLGPLLVVGLLSAAAWVIQHELSNYTYEEITSALWGVRLPAMLLAVGLTAANYLVMTCYDILAVRTVGKRLAVRRIALAAFIGAAYSNSLGLALLAGGSIRLRLYTAWGLTTMDVARIIFFTTATLWLGLAAVGGLSMLVWPTALPAWMPGAQYGSLVVGGALLTLVAAYLGAGAMGKGRLTVRSVELPLPRFGIALTQVVSGALDWVLAAAVLWVLLPEGAGVPFAKCLVAFLVAQIGGLASQIPGGLGVFESAILLTLGNDVPGAQLLATLLAYRFAYYLLPLSAATLLLGVREIMEVRAAVLHLTRTSARWVRALAPRLLAAATFVGGCVLLTSGATPAIERRLEWLDHFLPLEIMEASHFLGSVAGLALLFLARGIQHRLDAAYYLTSLFFGVGIAASLLKGWDYEEALILSTMLIALLPARRYFYRRSSLLNETFTPWWLMSIAVVLGATTWLGFFCFRHVEYSDKLWWQFTVSGDASRFLRALVGMGAVAFVLGLARLLTTARHRPPAPSGSEIEAVRAIVAASPRSSAALALLGDKSFLFSESGKSFIMYGVERHCWVSMGDPVGKPEEFPELVWRFREMCDLHGVLPVFYEVGREQMPLYLDLGLDMLKLGEAAVIPLSHFSISGRSRKNFRYILNHLDDEGCTFEILPNEAVGAVVEELRPISEAWLKEKNTREKRFSLGCFDPVYLAQSPVALVRCRGRAVAFVNLWLGADKSELSVDLMRYAPDGPEEVMEYLLLKLILWAKAEGYQHLDLGMAPLSGIKSRQFATLWNRFGAFLFQHGEYFYNFQGLRRYKAKFGPVWEPRYLASPSGLRLPFVLAGVASLVSGGLRGVVTK